MPAEDEEEAASATTPPPDGGDRASGIMRTESLASPLLDQRVVSSPFTDEVAQAVADMRAHLQAMEAALGPDHQPLPSARAGEGDATPTHRLSSASAAGVPAAPTPQVLRSDLESVVTAFERQVLLMFNSWDVEVTKRNLLLQQANIDLVNKLRDDMVSPHTGRPPPQPTAQAMQLLKGTAAQPHSAANPSKWRGSQPSFAIQGTGEGDACLRVSGAVGPEGLSPAPSPSVHARKPTAVAAGGGQGKTSGKSDLKKATALSLFLHLNALAAQVQASQAVLYYFDKTTSTLRSIASVPHGVNVTIPAHLGVQGAVLSSGVAFNLNKIHEDQAPLFKSADAQAGRTTRSLLLFPLLSGVQKSPIGLVELVNKRGNLKFTCTDESTACHASHTLFHVIRFLPSDLVQSLDGYVAHAGIGHLPASSAADDTADFAPFSLPDSGGDKARPTAPPCAEVAGVGGAASAQGAPADPKGCDGGAEPAGGFGARMDAGQTSRTQLVFRPDRGSKLDVASSATKGAPLTDCSNVKELHNYLQTLEESYRRGLNKYVLVDAEKNSLQDELTKKTQRVRVLEDNITHLNSQVQQLQAKAGQAVGTVAGHGANYGNYATEMHFEEQEGGRGGGQAPPSLMWAKLDADHPAELRETLSLAQRLASVINAPPAVTTSVPSDTLPKLKVKPKPSPSLSGQALRAVQQRRPPPTDAPTVIQPGKYRLSHAGHSGGRMALRK